MTRADRFRQQAALCERQAQALADPEDRARFELLASRWREMAEQIEATDRILEADVVWARAG